MKYYTELNRGNDIDYIYNLTGKLDIDVIVLKDENLASKIINLTFISEYRDYEFLSDEDLYESIADMDNIDDIDDYMDEHDLYLQNSDNYISIDITGHKYIGMNVDDVEDLYGHDSYNDLHDFAMDDCFFINLTIETETDLSKEELHKLTKIIRVLSKDNTVEFIELDN